MRIYPLPSPDRIFPLPSPWRIFHVPATETLSINPGNSKRLLIGERGYPFGELDVDPAEDVSTIKWMKAGDGSWTDVVLGTYPDLITAARYVSFTPTAFNALLAFTLRITDTSTVIHDRQVDIVSDVDIASDKHAGLNQRFRPFSDATFATNAAYVTAIQYEVAGTSVVAKTAIVRKTVVSGTHNGTGNNARLVDTTKNFLILGVRAGDIVTNVTDGSTATVASITTTTNAYDTLVLSALTGGTDNDFDAADSYTVKDGDTLILIAQKHELSFATAGRRTVTLYVTDASSNEFSDAINVFVG